MDKKSLFDGVSIGKVNLCVKAKAITRYVNGLGVTFLRKMREGDQEKNKEKFKTDKLVLFVPCVI